MNIARLGLLLPLAVFLACNHDAGSGKSGGLPHEPEALVRSLYTQVVALHPLGIPPFEVFAPYISQALFHRLVSYNDCLDDWDRQNMGKVLKPPLFEGGLFSGFDLRVEPQAFSIERVQAEKDGSVLVQVKLSREEPSEPTWVWRVAAVLVRENGRLVVDDVIWLRDRPQGVDVRVSKVLAEGCDGPHWVGDQMPADRRPSKR